MPKLSSNQLQEYNDNGYVAPIEVLTKDQAFEIRKEIENIETKWPDELKGAGRNYVHMISPILDEVCHNSKMLDAVESIIGKEYSYLWNNFIHQKSTRKGICELSSRRNIYWVGTT